jgi:peroxiredoxin
MMISEQRPPVTPGELAPDFSLPALAGDMAVSLADYRGKSAVFLALMVGLWCPFCRRHIAQLGAAEPKLKEAGADCLAIVATPLENARLYFKFRPTRLRLGADPELTTHRAYGLPKPTPSPELLQAMETTRINPTGELSEPLPVAEAAAALAKLDGYVETATDQVDMDRQWPQLKGQFLVDRDGIIRWANIECSEGLTGVGKFPSIDEIVAVARALPHG